MQFALRGVFRSQLVSRSLLYQLSGTETLRPSSSHLRYGHSKCEKSCHSHRRFIKSTPSALRYTSDHELIKFDDTTGIGAVSITHHAQSALGDVVFVELPKVGSEVKQGGL